MDRREILKLAAVLGGSAVCGSPGALFAASSEDPMLSLLHPDLRPVVKQLSSMASNAPPLSLETLPVHRKSMTGYASKPLADVAFEKRTIPGMSGQPDVTIFVVNASPGTSRPAILHTHGGGFVLGSAEQAVPDLQKLCKELDCVAVTVDYRLAPETTYRGSMEDNYAGLKWLHTNAEQLGVDPNRIAVMGESAGGGHAALLAITARDRGEVPVCFQSLTYPMLDDRTGSSRAMPPHVGKIVWTPESNRFGWTSFLGMKPGGTAVPSSAVPARVQNLTGLPPAWIGVGSLDLFCDEDVDYAQRLNNVGVPAELIVVPGAFHGFDNPMIPAAISRWFINARLDALRLGLGQNHW